MFSKPSASAPYPHIWSKDASLDTEADDFDHEQWVKTGDAKHIPVKNGVNPVEFTLKHLSTKELDAVKDTVQQYGPFAARRLAVRMALTKITPFVIDGKLKDLHRPNLPGIGFRGVDDIHLDIIAAVDDGKLYEELAARVMQEEFPDPT